MVKRSTDEPANKALLRLQQFEAARAPQEKEEKPAKKAVKKKANPQKPSAKKSSKKK